MRNISKTSETTAQSPMQKTHPSLCCRYLVRLFRLGDWVTRSLEGKAFADMTLRVQIRARSAHRDLVLPGDLLTRTW